MMGERDPQKQLWNYQVNLDKRVCSDHPLRRINETLELGFVRREVAKFYHTKGNVSEDPIIIMKMIVRVALCNILAKRSGSGVSEPWSNGPVEGQLNRLKVLKLQMYGRAGIELLRARLLPEPAFSDP